MALEDNVGYTVEQIEAFTVEELETMLRLWHYAPLGTFITGEPATTAFKAKLTELRAAHPQEWVAASKAIG